MTLYFAKLCYTAIGRPRYRMMKSVNTWQDIPNPAREDGKWPGNGREEARLAVREHLKGYALRDDCLLLLVPEHRHHVMSLAPEHMNHPAVRE